MASRKQDRIFNQTGWRHYRRRYSLTEVRIGLIILLVLMLTAVWVAWRGANPDPELFSVESVLLDKGSEWTPLEDRKAISESLSGSRASGSASSRSQDRGPVPTGLATEGWSERPVAQFDSDTLYEKINGREGYYKSFGFKRLYYISLSNDKDETAAVDIEMYDLGTVANALGAYSGERPPDVKPEISDAGISHLARNAMFIVRGRYYVRAIGTDETEPIKAVLEHLRTRFADGLTGESLPWAYTLFVAQLGLDPGKIGYAPENALSFGFARHVYTVELNEDGTEYFVAATPDEKSAAALAEQFTTEGFLGLGTAAGSDGGIDWVKDRYLDTVAGTTSVGPVVVGIHRAPDLNFAREALDKLKTTAVGLPRALIERAVAAQSESDGEKADDYGGDSGEKASDGQAGEEGSVEAEGEPSYDDEEPGGAGSPGEPESGAAGSSYDEPSPGAEEIER
ncbi:MAG: hypothetical protein MJE77_34535 [Proteobacteria bacterium]|nr:hypothetical protein [Pseudomonadota bacterium]